MSYACSVDISLLNFCSNCRHDYSSDSIKILNFHVNWVYWRGYRAFILDSYRHSLFHCPINILSPLPAFGVSYNRSFKRRLHLNTFLRFLSLTHTFSWTSLWESGKRFSNFEPMWLSRLDISICLVIHYINIWDSICNTRTWLFQSFMERCPRNRVDSWSHPAIIASLLFIETRVNVIAFLNKVPPLCKNRLCHPRFSHSSPSIYLFHHFNTSQYPAVSDYCWHDYYIKEYPLK